MSADWKAGDKALCVDFKGLGVPDGIPMPVNGIIYLVEEICHGVRNGRPDIGLALVGLPNINAFNARTGYWHGRFSKIVPACDKVTITKQFERYYSDREQGLTPHEGFWEKRSDL